MSRSSRINSTGDGTLRSSSSSAAAATGVGGGVGGGAGGGGGGDRRQRAQLLRVLLQLLRMLSNASCSKRTAGSLESKRRNSLDCPIGAAIRSAIGQICRAARTDKSRQQLSNIRSPLFARVLSYDDQLMQHRTNAIRASVAARVERQPRSHLLDRAAIPHGTAPGAVAQLAPEVFQVIWRDVARNNLGHGLSPLVVGVLLSGC